MIKYNDKEIYEVRRDDKIISYIRKGLYLVYQAIRSCFGTGIWREDKKWLDADKWKDNKK